LKEEKGSCVDVARNSDIWPITAGIERREKRELSFPIINLKY